MHSKSTLDAFSIGLHWVVAVFIVGLATIGVYMTKAEAWGFYEPHKSIGILIFAVILVRVVWRLKKGLPEPVRPFSRFEHAASKAVHWGLLIASVAMPITGMLFSGAGGYGFGIFGLELAPGNHGPDGQAVPFNAGLSDAGHVLHSYIGYVLIFLVLLHVAGALKHHFIDRDATLKRMLGSEGGDEKPSANG